jgi:spermidine synthase
MLGHLSVLAHKDPDNVEDVLVVACGAGVTAGSFVPYPHIKDITICDIEKLVPTKVTPQFHDANYGIVDGIDKENPKTMPDGKTVKVEYDDGRHFIRTLPADKKYDIITSDPIDPWVKGCAALNTVEYYQMCKDHLKPGGVMSLWIPLYESNEDTSKSVIGTFFKVFPNGILFSNDERGAGYDAVLFGRVEDTTINIDEMEQRLERPEYAKVKQSLIDVGFGSQKHLGLVDAATSGVAVDLLSTYAARAADLTLPPASGGPTWAREDLINTDYNLKLQYLAGRWLNTYMEATILSNIFKYYEFPNKVFIGSPDRIAALKEALQENGRPSLAQVGSAERLASGRVK